EIFEGAQHRALLLFLGARGAERVSVGAREGCLAEQRPDARPQDGNDSRQRTPGKDQDGEACTPECPCDRGEHDGGSGQADFGKLSDLGLKLVRGFSRSLAVRLISVGVGGAHSSRSSCLSSSSSFLSYSSSAAPGGGPPARATWLFASSR